jgi:PAT family beta-lactamase induction signal transducer AmpG
LKRRAFLAASALFSLFAPSAVLAAVPRTFINAYAGVLVERLGWVPFFLLCFLLALPGMLLLLKVAPWNETPPPNA